MPKRSVLALWERQIIERYHARGHSIRQIAKALARDHSTIVRELGRNTTSQGYRARRANDVSGIRSRKTNKRKLDRDPALRAYVVARISSGWSPEQVAGRLKHQPPKTLIGKTVSHEAIYSWIYDGQGKFEGLIPRLRRRQGRRRKKGRKSQKLCIPNRKSIHGRPVKITERKEIGHWEDDTVIYTKCKAVLAVQKERSLMLMRITKVNDKTAFAHEQALRRRALRDPKGLWKTTTRDNGTENVLHDETRKQYGIRSYFCDPYSSWQKGGVENGNGLIRDLLPADTDLSLVPQEDIALIEHLLNTRPRKKLNYLTPNEALDLHLKRKRKVVL